MLTFADDAVAMGKSDSGQSNPEFSVCGWWREPLAFWTFRRVAGEPDARRVAGIRDLDRIEFTTADGRRLGGYRLRAQNPQGYVLIAPGNAMLADQIVGEFQPFRDRGFDVYLYDYRGYGLSEGRSRLNAIVSDYREIVQHLNRGDYRRRALYGMSMGGVILLNAVAAGLDYSALMVDSSPSRISHLGCPEGFDPVQALPPDGRRVQLIVGERDRVVRPAEIEELAQALEKRGGRVLRRSEYAHPFQDAALTVHRRRLDEVADFLLR